jgi:hypothetical protein
MECFVVECEARRAAMFGSNTILDEKTSMMVRAFWNVELGAGR